MVDYQLVVTTPPGQVRVYPITQERSIVVALDYARARQ